MARRIPVFLIALALASCNSEPPSQPDVYGTQPQTTISLLEGSTAAEDVPKVVAAAKAFWKPTDDYWPEPSSVTERETFWWVKFKEKETVTVRNGRQVIKTSVPGVQCIQVEKRDWSCSFAGVR